MVSSDAMYLKVPLDGVDSQHSAGSRAFKVGIALIGGCGLVLLSVMSISASGPTLRSTSAESTSLFGLPAASMGVAKKTSPLLPQTMGSLPGPSPWKELALAGIEASSRCYGSSRDVSMNANPVKSVLASMDSKSRAIVAAAETAAITKMEDLKAGQTAPMGFFDPLGLSTNLPQGRLLFFREAELKHGRVCMLASLGFLVGENFHPLFGGNIDVPSYIAFQETPLQTFWVAVSVAIALPEVLLSVPGFNEPTPSGKYSGYQDTWTIKSNRVPGDFGFDPLGLKPKDAQGFLEMQNKELNNGRLAMIGIAGMVAQELVTGDKILVTDSALR